MSQLRLRPLGFGEILDGAFTLYRQNFPTFFTTALLALIPITLLTRSIESASLAMGRGGASEGGPIAMVLLAAPLTVLGWLLVWAALTRQTAERYEGRETSLRDGYMRAARALPALIGSTILIFLLTMVVIAAAAVIVVLASLPLALLGGTGWVAAAYGGLTTLLAMLLFAAAMTSLFAVVPAVMVERAGSWGAIRRSHRLARGARARIVAIIVVSSLIVLLPTLGLTMAAGMGAALWDISAAATLSPVQLFAQQFITILASALTTPFMVGCITLLYFDRRVRAEGYDLEIAADDLAAHALG